MVCVNEIRVGNIIQTMGAVGPVTSFNESVVWLGKPIDRDDIERIGSVSYGLANPVSMNRAWMRNFAFERIPFMQFGGRDFAYEKVYSPNSGGPYKIILSEITYDGDLILELLYQNGRAQIRYVHELQNLYFSLTREELILKPVEDRMDTRYTPH